jgi:hypothetical protein
LECFGHQRAIARETEAAGFEAIFATEVNTDVLATAQLMGEATTRIKVGSWGQTFICAILICVRRALPLFPTPPKVA